ncbi:MAG: hypothetical protein KKB62_03465, partial [Nanoarchaeota archaeon]|nr:hypothetical protein [Nanoarchaeota archaeon]
MVNKPDKQILEYKKNLFTEHVGKSAKLLDVPVPKVKFWGHWGDHFHEGERAHIHIEENKICIAETELNLMTEEEIKVTASHEVSHIHHQDHGMEFQRTQNITEFGLWERPPGTIGALPEDYEPEKIKERKNRQVKYRCNYHLCNKRTKTKKCKYCENYFCADHINPSEPHMGNISESYNRLEEKNTHPCMPYFHYLEKKKKLEDERYGKALDRMFFRKKEAQVVEYKIIPKKETERKSKPDNLERERIHQKDEEIKKTLREGLEMHRLKKRRKKRPILIIVILFLIL